jgi:hypothetical protein
MRPLAIALVLAVGCGDEPSGAGTSTGSTDVGITGSSADASAGLDSTVAGLDSTAADAASSSGELPLELEIFTYPNQPMVVDLAFSAPALDVTVEHATDLGVRAGTIAGPAGQTWVRVRGLAPATEHPLTWSVQAPDGRTALGDVTFETEPPLPGFVPSFPIGGLGDGHGGYVMLDLLDLRPGSAGASLLVVDTNGVTRWHTSRGDGLVGPAAVYAAPRMRSDGSLLFVRELSLSIVDELGATLTMLTPRDLGLPGLHHDVLELESGNFLALSMTFRDIDYPELGLTHVAGDLIVELTPEGDVVWEWDAFDHLDPMRRRDGFEDEIFDPATGQAGQDWTHGNGIVLDEATGTLLFSMRHQDWVIAIDVDTGDVLWRLGEEGDFALTAGTWSYHQHSPQWQDDGTLLLYDNGLGNPGLDDALETSRAVRYALDLEAMTATQVWEDEAEPFMAPIAGDADRLPDGSILVTDSAIDLGLGVGSVYARIREIDERASATPQWTLTTELGTFVYRCTATERLPGE